MNPRGRMSRLVARRQRWSVTAALLFAAVATGVETSDAADFPVAASAGQRSRNGASGPG